MREAEEALREAEEALREAEETLRPQRPAPVVRTAERRVLSASLAQSASLGRLPLIRMASLAALKRPDEDAKPPEVGSTASAVY